MVSSRRPTARSAGGICIAKGTSPLLFTENDTNNEQIFGTPNASPYVKDGINNYVIHGKQDAVNPGQTGTKAAAHYIISVGARETATIRLRLSDLASTAIGDPFNSFAETMQTRQREADEFYRAITPERVPEDEARVMRQALAGMLWTKQYFNFDVAAWLKEHGVDPERPAEMQMRNSEWSHMVNEHVISMPDKWEYPWYAAWDLAFHTIALSTVDVDFAKEQLDLMLQNYYLHPTGQMPAYEWNFSDVNPPVHAWAAIFLYRTEQALHGEGDLDFLKRSFAKLALNFTWWVNRKDRFGKNLFEGASSGWTISAFSTEARRCPQAATWSRPMARPGSQCSARTCWRSAWSL
jgi:mannosylglycerate hydrolase MGH1-like protein